MDKKAALLRWQQEHQIPGKIQSMLTAQPSAAGDWCIRNSPHGNQMRLDILGPSEDLDPPEVVEAIFNYLIQEHQYYLRKAMTQLWIRAAAKNTWALVLHSQIRGAGTGHALKLFETFLTRNRPDVVAFHRVETRPWFPFRFDHPPRAMRYELKPLFGPEILPLDESGLSFHVLEWLPQLRHPFLALPARLLGAIHAMPGDKLLDLHCGAGIFGCSMAKSFQEVHCIDARGISNQSVAQNIKNLGIRNLQYSQETVDAKFIIDFFAKHKQGPWTVILNPQQGEALPVGVIKEIAGAPVGRIIHICSDLEIAETEIRRWRRAGMMLRKIIPFDLNPTTNRIEIALFFAPDREGVLRRVAAPSENGEPGNESSSKQPVEPGLRFVQKGRTTSRTPEKRTEEKPRTRRTTTDRKPVGSRDDKKSRPRRNSSDRAKAETRPAEKALLSRNPREKKSFGKTPVKKRSR